MQRTAREHLEKSQRTLKRLYDNSSSKRHLQVGDEALVLPPTPASKLEVCWTGSTTIDTGKNHSFVHTTSSSLANGNVETE